LITFQAAATQFTVTTDADLEVQDGKCSLREAIAAFREANSPQLPPVKDCSNSKATGQDSIVFAPTVSKIVLQDAIYINHPHDADVIDTLDIIASHDVIIDGGVTPNNPGVNHRIFNIVGTSPPGANYQSFRVKLYGLTLQNANTDGSGSAIYADLTSTGRLQIFKTRVQKSMSTGPGGAMMVTGGTLEIVNSAFIGNSTANEGGALNRSGKTFIDHTVFDDNNAWYSGGAINCSSGVEEVFSIVNTTFRGNSAYGQHLINYEPEGGGAIKTTCKMNILSSRFENNFTKSGGSGGAIYIGAGLSVDAAGSKPINITGRTVFIGNQASAFIITNGISRGGAVYARSPFLCNSCYFQQNRSKGGGAVAIELNDSNILTKADIVSSQFSNNTAENMLLTPNGSQSISAHGSAILTGDKTGVNFSNVTLYANSGLSAIYNGNTAASPQLVAISNSVLYDEHYTCAGGISNYWGAISSYDTKAIPDCPGVISKPGIKFGMLYDFYQALAYGISPSNQQLGDESQLPLPTLVAYEKQLDKAVGLPAAPMICSQLPVDNWDIVQQKRLDNNGNCIAGSYAKTMSLGTIYR